MAQLLPLVTAAGAECNALSKQIEAEKVQVNA
jgi:hypothetical protein